jgi:hypothetical protein
MTLVDASDRQKRELAGALKTTRARGTFGPEPEALIGKKACMGWLAHPMERR